jgi:hypothetical protein
MKKNDVTRTKVDLLWWLSIFTSTIPFPFLKAFQEPVEVLLN